MTIVERNLEKVNEMYSNKKSDAKIGREIGCTSEMVRLWRVKNQLPPNGRIVTKHSKLKSSIINEDEFLDLYNQGFMDKKIAEILNVNANTVFRFRNSMGLSPVEKYEKIKLNDFEYQILLGHTLGDGCLKKPNLNASGKIEQSTKQKEYFFWKHNALKKLSNGKYSENSKFDDRTNNTYHSLSSYLKSHPILTKLYNITYINGVKEMNKDNLLNFHELALAVLFMDDGFKCTTGGVGIALNGLSAKSLEEFVKMMYYRFKINCNYDSQHRIYIKKSETSKFRDLIKQYVIPEMEYKLTVPIKSDKLLEPPEEGNQQPTQNLNGSGRFND